MSEQPLTDDHAHMIAAFPVMAAALEIALAFLWADFFNADNRDAIANIVKEALDKARGDA